MPTRHTKRIADRAAQLNTTAGSTPWEQLHALHRLEGLLQTALDDTLVRARTAGVTWRELAEALDMTSQGAQRRWRAALKRKSS